MPLTDDYKRRLNQKKSKIKVIDFRKATDLDNDIYTCENCDIRLIPYHDIEGKRLTRGKLFQCGKCGQIKDTSMDNLQHPSALVSRGDEQSAFFTMFRQPSPVKQKQQQYDPEPSEDKFMTGNGFHIVRTRIISGDGRVLRDDSNSL